MGVAESPMSRALASWLSASISAQKPIQSSKNLCLGTAVVCMLRRENSVKRPEGGRKCRANKTALQDNHHNCLSHIELC